MKDPNLKSLLAFTMLSTRTHPMSKYVDDMDRKILRRRALAEGIPFLCVLLPSLGKALEASLESGVWTTPPGFKNQVSNGRPCFLQNCFNLIFDEQSNLRVDVDVKLIAEAVLVIRQLTLAHGKCDFGGVNPTHVTTAWASFKENQARISNVDLNRLFDPKVNMTLEGSNIPLRVVMRIARKLVHRMFANFSVSDVVPKHGKGAAAIKSLTPQRYDVHRHVYSRLLDKVMPYSDFLFSGGAHLSDEMHRLQALLEQDEFHDSAAFVSKDFTKVRGISKIHPTLMYFGQALRGYMEGVMKSPEYRNELDISDQERNKLLALIGSLTSYWSTMDLTDASDSLLREIVMWLFPDPLCTALLATCATGTVFKGEKVAYSCYAPMGSPTCFPVQTICFWALAKAACICTRSGTRRDPISVSVYGDDIICPTDCYTAVSSILTAVGLKVNHNKSFHKGRFRESCGGDYYGGEDVSIVRCKKPPIPTTRARDVSSSVLRYADLYSRLIRRYKISAYEDVYDSIRNHITSAIPSGLPEIYCKTDRDAEEIANSGCLPSDGRTNPRGFPVKWNPRLQRRELTTLSVKPATIGVITRGTKSTSRHNIYVSSGWSLVLASLVSMPIHEHDNRRRYAPGHVGNPCPVTTRNEWTLRDSNVVTLRTIILNDN
jgi:hypothetical protein